MAQVVKNNPPIWSHCLRSMNQCASLVKILNALLEPTTGAQWAYCCHYRFLLEGSAYHLGCNKFETSMANASSLLQSKIAYKSPAET